MPVTAAPLPAAALLQRYADQWKHRDALPYTDSFVVLQGDAVDLPAFVEAFYTTWIFTLERWILSVALKRASTDQQAHELARGTRQDFAAWQVEARTDQEILLADLRGRTRSWLMVEPVADADTGVATTRLWFGSAVVPMVDGKTGRAELGTLFTVLLGFHKFYSRLLLGAAVKKLRRQAR